MLTKFIKLMGLVVIVLLVSSPVLAASYDLQNTRFQNTSMKSALARNPMLIFAGVGLVR